jgi:hypothetical protein
LSRQPGLAAGRSVSLCVNIPFEGGNFPKPWGDKWLTLVQAQTIPPRFGPVLKWFPVQGDPGAL